MATCPQRGTSPSRKAELHSGTHEIQDKMSAEQRWFDTNYVRPEGTPTMDVCSRLNDMDVEIKKFLCSLRDDTTTVIKRDSLISQNDSQNIKKHMNINVSSSEKHADDKTSVGLWVEELAQEDNNPIICYKPQNTEHKYLQMEDFLLCIQTKFQKEMMKEHASKIILMDSSTHGTNQYDFYLTTILVLDGYQQSIPVAWAISNREDANILQVFMEAIRSHSCDQSFETDFFMSDLANTFYNAWCQVFPKPKQRLFCDLHLDRAWRQIAQELIKDHEPAEHIYHCIKTLQQILVESDFRRCLQGFLTYVDDFPAFRTYFLNMYVLEGKISQWAHCFRVDSPTSSNMHAESFHRVLKTNYNRKQNKRVDNLVCILLKIAEDTASDQLLTKKMGTVSAHMIDIGQRHRGAEDIVGIERNAEEEDEEEIIEWIVPPSPGHSHNQMYRVTQNSDQPCGCKLICDLCSVCVHMYNCTCEDFRRKKVICKHIHAVHMAFKFNRDMEQNDNEQEETSDSSNSDNVVELASSCISVLRDIRDLLQDALNDGDVNTLQVMVQGLRETYQQCAQL